MQTMGQSRSCGGAKWAGAAVAVLATGALSTVLVGCPGATLPTPKCAATQLPSDPLGGPSPRAGRASIRLEAKGFYIAALVRRIIDQLRPEDPNASSGVEMGAIRLTEEGTGAQRQNLVSLPFSAWLRGQDGSHVMLPGRTYKLQLQVLPHLLTRQNTPDLATRRAFLDCADDAPCETGLVVMFAFKALLGGGQRAANAPVDCTKPDYDLIDEQVLTRSLEATAALRPMGVALDGVMAVLRTRLALDVHAIGIDLGTDQHLVLGLLLDAGTPSTFDNIASALGHSDDVDWAVELDTALLAPAIRSKVLELARQRISGAVFSGSPSVAFESAGITLGLAGTAPAGVCGGVPFSASALALPAVCGYALGACANTPAHPIAVTVTPRDSGQAACLDVAKFLKSIADQVHAVTVALAGGTPASTSTPPTCTAITSPVQYAIGKHDVVYPLRLDTDEAFIVAGRSQLMDNLNPQRTPPPLSGCSW